jgi:hypothetical protein
MYPPPTTSRRFGTSGSSSAVVESRTFGLSIDTFGTFVGSEPVAMMTKSVSIFCCPPEVSTLNVFASTKDARPWTKFTLRDFASSPRPPVCFLTTASFQERSLSMSMVGVGKDTPKASACFASSSTLAACNSAFEGMQPRNVHTPPGFGSASMSVTCMPMSAA